ncbi:MAG: fibronectin type III domain-containing protein, partial [Bacteroidetes bacterium]|nr:fibronectin type III domain-containing protein [Bacteroidota bacterium]
NVTTVTTWIGQDDETIQATTCDEGEAGTVTTTETNAAGCTYNVTTITTWVGQDDETIQATTCDEGEAGTVTTTETNVAGCTYNVTTVTTWVGQDDETIQATTCDEGEAGTVTVQETNAAGCTYDVTTITTWVGQDDETVEETTCDPNEVGTSTVSLTNSAGCPYLVTTVTTLGNDCVDECTTPENLYATNITLFNAVLGWDAVPGADKYHVQGRLKYNILGITVNRHVRNNRFRTNFLFPFTTYQFRVRTKCLDGSWSEFSNWYDFTTNPFIHRDQGSIVLTEEESSKIVEVDLFDVDKIFTVYQDFDRIGVAYYGEELGQGTISVTDITGRTYHYDNFELVPYHSTILKTGELGSGMYFVNLIKDGIVLESEKIMLVK